ncbi:hypothetical protein [Sorangium sp. So ce176]|uniref:hypothetical protein n=1 Tax=Sorangium sp. So ce176 TaxID=3133286 RepID=UPI003F62BD05
MIKEERSGNQKQETRNKKQETRNKNQKRELKVRIRSYNHKPESEAGTKRREKNEEEAKTKRKGKTVQEGSQSERARRSEASSADQDRKNKLKRSDGTAEAKHEAESFESRRRGKRSSDQVRQADHDKPTRSARVTRTSIILLHRPKAAVIR